jgi:hypothetical protein
MTSVKFYNNQRLSDIEKNINEFLKKERVKQLIDIKFNALNKNGIDEYTALIIYEENMQPGKEDPQMYE